MPSLRESAEPFPAGFGAFSFGSCPAMGRDSALGVRLVCGGAGWSTHRDHHLPGSPLHSLSRLFQRITTLRFTISGAGGLVDADKSICGRRIWSRLARIHTGFLKA